MSDQLLHAVEAYRVNGAMAPHGSMQAHRGSGVVKNDHLGAGAAENQQDYEDGGRTGDGYGGGTGYGAAAVAGYGCGAGTDDTIGAGYGVGANYGNNAGAGAVAGAAHRTSAEGAARGPTFYPGFAPGNCATLAGAMAGAAHRTASEGAARGPASYPGCVPQVIVQRGSKTHAGIENHGASRVEGVGPLRYQKGREKVGKQEHRCSVRCWEMVSRSTAAVSGV